MQIVAYIYTDPLIEEPPSVEIWGWEIDRVYQDLGQRHARNRLKSLPPPGKASYGYRRGKDKYTIDRRDLF
jgi:hypothetical protein